MLVAINGVPPNGWFMMEHPKEMDENWGYLNSGNHQRISDFLISEVLQIRSPK